MKKPCGNDKPATRARRFKVRPRSPTGRSRHFWSCKAPAAIRTSNRGDSAPWRDAWQAITVSEESSSCRLSELPPWLKPVATDSPGHFVLLPRIFQLLYHTRYVIPLTICPNYGSLTRWATVPGAFPSLDEPPESLAHGVGCHKPRSIKFRRSLLSR